MRSPSITTREELLHTTRERRHTATKSPRTSAKTHYSQKKKKWLSYPIPILMLNFIQLCNPMSVACQTPLSMGFFQAWILEWVAIPFSRGSSWPRDWTHVSHVSCVSRWIRYHWAIGEAPSTFPSHVPWGCWVPGVETWQQNPSQSGSAAANKVVTQPRCTMTLHIYEVKHSVPHSHPPHFKCSVASCAQVLWCCSEQMFKKSRHHG